MQNKYFTYRHGSSDEGWLPKRLSFLASTTPSTTDDEDEDESKTLGEIFQEEHGVEEGAEKKIDDGGSMQELRKKITDINNMSLADMANERGEIIAPDMTDADKETKERTWKKEMREQTWQDYASRLGTKAENEINSISETVGGIDEVKTHAIAVIEKLKAGDPTKGLEKSKSEIGVLTAIANSIEEMGLSAEECKKTQNLTLETEAKQMLYETRLHKQKSWELKLEQHDKAYENISNWFSKLNKIGLGLALTAALAAPFAIGAFPALGAGIIAMKGTTAALSVAGIAGTFPAANIATWVGSGLIRLPRQGITGLIGMGVDWKKWKFDSANARLSYQKHKLNEQKADITKKLTSAQNKQKLAVEALSAVERKMQDLKARKIEETDPQWIETEKAQIVCQATLDDAGALVRVLENVQAGFAINDAYASMNMPKQVLTSLTAEKLNPQLQNALTKLDKEHDTSVLKAQKTIVETEEKSLTDELAEIGDPAKKQIKLMLKKLAGENPVEGAFFDATLAKYKNLSKAKSKMPNLLKVLKAYAALPKGNAFKTALEKFLKTAIAAEPAADDEAPGETLAEKMVAQNARSEEVANRLANQGNDTVKRVLFGTTANADAVKLMNYAFRTLKSKLWFKEADLPLNQADTESLLRSVSMIATNKEIFKVQSLNLNDIKLKLKAITCNNPQEFLKELRSAVIAYEFDFPQDGREDWDDIYEDHTKIDPAAKSDFCSAAFFVLADLGSHTDLTNPKDFSDKIIKIQTDYGTDPVPLERAQLAIVKAAEVAKTKANAADKITTYIETLEKLMKLNLLDQEFDKKMIPVTGAQPRSIRDFLGDADLLRIGDLDKIAKVGKTPVNLDNIAILDITAAITALGPIDPAKFKILGAAGNERLVPNEVGAWKEYIIGKIFQNRTGADETPLALPAAEVPLRVKIIESGKDLTAQIATRLQAVDPYKGRFTNYLANKRPDGTHLRTWLAGLTDTKILEEYNDLIGVIMANCVDASGLTFLAAKDCQTVLGDTYFTAAAGTVPGSPEEIRTDYMNTAPALERIFEIARTVPGARLPATMPASITDIAHLAEWITDEADYDQVQTMKQALELIGAGKRYQFVPGATTTGTPDQIVDTSIVVPPPVPPPMPPPASPAGPSGAPPSAISGPKLTSALGRLAKLTLGTNANLKAASELFVNRDIQSTDLLDQLKTITGWNTLSTGKSLQDQISSMTAVDVDQGLQKLETEMPKYIPWRENLNGNDYSTIRNKDEVLTSIIDGVKPGVDSIVDAFANQKIKTIKNRISGTSHANPFSPTDASAIQPKEIRVWSTTGSSEDSDKTLADLGMEIDLSGGSLKIGGNPINTIADPRKLQIIWHNINALRWQLGITSGSTPTLIYRVLNDHVNAPALPANSTSSPQVVTPGDPKDKPIGLEHYLRKVP